VSDGTATTASPAADRLVLLTNAAMTARRRPLAIALLWAYEALVALALAWPFAAFVRSSYGAHPDGDAPLWHPGGLALADLMLRSGSSGNKELGAALSAHTTFALGIGAAVGLLPLAVLVVSIAFTTPDRGHPPLRRVLDRAVGAFPAFFSLLLLMSIVEFAFVALAVGAGATTSGLAMRSLGDARAQQLGAAVALPIALLALVAGVLHDLARTAVVRFDAGALAALRFALTAMRRTKGRPMWSWTWRALVGLVLIAIASAVSTRLGGRAGFALVALTVIHQLVTLSRVALRASWMAKALRLVDDAGCDRRA
jgi:hypothetical protein